MSKEGEGNMQLYIPTKLYSEKECVKNHGGELASWGTKAMIVTGKKSSRMNGSLDDVETVLKIHNRPYIIFDEVEENPSIETIMKARNIGIEEQVDFIIGIGGGSPLDAAKAIALMIANPEETEEVFYESKELKYLPVICVPTTCGTGSEVTPYSILTIHKKRTKKSIRHKIYPELALLDASYLKSMSRLGLVHTAVDALAHLVESYLNTNSNEWNRVYSREGLKVWAQFKESLAKDCICDVDYEKMLRASALGGMAITHTGTSLPHGLSYPFTYECGYSHGKAVGMFLAGYVCLYKDAKEVGDVMRLLDFDEVSEFVIYMKKLLGDVDINQDVLTVSVENIMADAGKLKNYPFAVTREELMTLIEG